MNDVLTVSLNAPRPTQPTRPRVVFIDVARALATLMMLQGHTIDALLSAEYRTGAAFYVWTFVRGLTPSLFLFLSGFAFTVVARQRTADPGGPTTMRRLRRVAWLLLLGYVLHFPAGSLAGLGTVGADGWRNFLAADVLQCIAVMLAALHLIKRLAPRPDRYLATAALACVAAVALTPFMWRVDWSSWLPGAIAAYASPATGSLFPLFPWTAYGFLGAAVGELYGRAAIRGTRRFADTALISGGLALIAASFAAASATWQPFGPTHFWSSSPSQFLLRAGIVGVVVGVIAHATRRVQRRLPIIEALAHESLAVYFVHVCLVYGSAWNPGLRQIHGSTLPPLAAIGWVLVLWAGMVLLARWWHWSKGETPKTAAWLRLATTGVLLAMLV